MKPAQPTPRKRAKYDELKTDEYKMEPESVREHAIRNQRPEPRGTIDKMLTGMERRVRSIKPEPPDTITRMKMNMYNLRRQAEENRQRETGEGLKRKKPIPIEYNKGGMVCREYGKGKR